MKYPTPIIFITALTDDQVRDKAFEQGASAFLGKPFSEEVLLCAIQAAIEVTRASSK
jgi:FixJ family two-component response regulator